MKTEVSLVVVTKTEAQKKKKEKKQMVSSSSSSNPYLRVKIPAAGEGKLTINVKSPTSEMYAEVKEGDKVRELEKMIKKAWGGDNDYMEIYHKSMKLKSDELLSSYNLRDGSVVTVSVLAEPPFHHHHHHLPRHSKSSCETKKNAKFQQETNSNSNGGNGCGSIVFHMANMFSQFCSSIFSSH